MSEREATDDSQEPVKPGAESTVVGILSLTVRAANDLVYPINPTDGVTSGTRVSAGAAAPSPYVRMAVIGGLVGQTKPVPQGGSNVHFGVVHHNTTYLPYSVPERGELTVVVGIWAEPPPASVFVNPADNPFDAYGPDEHIFVGGTNIDASACVGLDLAGPTALVFTCEVDDVNGREGSGTLEICLEASKVGVAAVSDPPSVLKGLEATQMARVKEAMKVEREAARLKQQQEEGSAAGRDGAHLHHSASTPSLGLASAHGASGAGLEAASSLLAENLKGEQFPTDLSAWTSDDCERFVVAIDLPQYAAVFRQLNGYRMTRAGRGLGEGLLAQLGIGDFLHQRRITAAVAHITSTGQAPTMDSLLAASGEQQLAEDMASRFEEQAKVKGPTRVVVLGTGDKGGEGGRMISARRVIVPRGTTDEQARYGQLPGGSLDRVDATGQYGRRDKDGSVVEVWDFGADGRSVARENVVTGAKDTGVIQRWDSRSGCLDIMFGEDGILSLARLSWLDRAGKSMKVVLPSDSELEHGFRTEPTADHGSDSLDQPQELVLHALKASEARSGGQRGQRCTLPGAGQGSKYFQKFGNGSNRGFSTVELRQGCKAVPSVGELKTDDRVAAKFPSARAHGERYFLGRVVSINQDADTVCVQFDDGETETAVPARRLMLLTKEPKAATPARLPRIDNASSVV